MAVHVVRLGTPRQSDEGLRLGTVRRPPRGVPKTEFASRDYYDAWLPNLAPSAELFGWLKAQPDIDKAWPTFARRYRSEMAAPDAQHLLQTLAAFSQRTDFSVGCYCEDERRCHRSLLRELLKVEGARVA
jgi:uncharacterized protein YeaO (DUF488 family)